MQPAGCSVQEAKYPFRVVQESGVLREQLSMFVEVPTDPAVGLGNRSGEVLGDLQIYVRQEARDESLLEFVGEVIGGTSRSWDVAGDAFLRSRPSTRSRSGAGEWPRGPGRHDAAPP
jgi:hypothetical protein